MTEQQVNNLSPELKAAYDRGYSAFYSGHHCDCYPSEYTGKIDHASAWMTGWHHAQRDNHDFNTNGGYVWEQNPEYGD